MRCIGSVRSSSDGASIASAIADRQPDAVHQPVAKSAENERADELGLAQRQEGRNPRAHRIAHHVGAFDVKVLKQIGRVAGHQVRAVVGRLIELLARAVASIVERDHPPPGPGQGLHPARIDPVDAMVGGEAVDQQNRLAAIRPLGRYVDIGDGDAIGREGLEHGPDMAGFSGPRQRAEAGVMSKARSENS